MRGAADKALGKQLSNYPKALGMSAAVMGAIALLPGIPMLPFLALAGGAAWLARKVDRDKKARLAAAASAAAPAADASDAPKEETITDLLKIDDLKIEIGYALLPLVNAADGQDRLTDQIKALRRQLAAELGFVMPSVRIVDNVQLEANDYVVRVKEIEAGHGQIFPASSWRWIRWAGRCSCPASTCSSRPSACRRPGSTARCATRRSCAATPWSTPRR